MKAIKVVKPSDILRKAASIINSDLSKSQYDRDGACDALDRADKALNSSYRNTFENSDAHNRAEEYFRSLFKPALHGDRIEQTYRSYWFGEPQSWSFLNDTRKAAQEHRIIALLMTADMAESVGQ